jgi:hypothetical protein
MKAPLSELRIGFVGLLLFIDGNMRWVDEIRTRRLDGRAVLLGTTGNLIRGVGWLALLAFTSCHLPTIMLMTF